MRRIKSLNILTILVLIWSMFGFITPVYASSATVGFSGNSTVAVGDNITITMYISDVVDDNGGVSSLEGNLSFESEYLEYVSGTGTTTPYRFQINTTANYKIAGLDTYLDSGITGSQKTTVFTFVFKALKEGTTQITLTNVKLTNSSDRITSNVSPKTITIGTSTPAKSNDATLKSLGATGYTLSPTFASGTTSYTITVPSEATSVTLTGTANHGGATVSGLGNITLTGDTTTATVKVTAEDGTTTKTYTVKINKETSSDTGDDDNKKSSDATLKSLSASGYTLSPSFSSSTTSYTVKVPSTATTVKLEGAANDSGATVTGLGNITLTGDTTTATIKVTAEDGTTTKTYKVKIEKEDETETTEKDSDATLKKLDVSGYTLSPTFKKNINTYSMKVKNNITSLDVTAIPTSDKAKVTISGNKNWEEGVNVVTIKVTAEDGTVNTYTVNVTRQSSNPDSEEDSKSTDNYLKSLTINSSHEISPKFNKNTSNYNVVVPYEVDKLDLSYVTNNSKAKVKVIGNESFKVGEVNTVEIEVTAEDGTKRIYTLNVTRSTEESGTDLEDIIIKGATLSPSFDPTILEYTTTVGGGVDKLDIKAIPRNDGSTVEIIGNENLKEGKNTVLVKVTDKNGFSKYYTIEVEKEAKENKILGLTPLQFGIISGIIGLLLVLLLLLLFRRRKEEVEDKDERPITPIIEVKPEFNFGSKNTSDDDVVHGNLNQNSQVKDEVEYEIPRRRTPAIEADYEETSVPYDPYDETVTKKEIIDAIKEATKTKDPAKLKMLLEQDALNQKKKELKKREEELRRRQEDSDDWR